VEARVFAWHPARDRTFDPNPREELRDASVSASEESVVVQASQQISIRSAKAAMSGGSPASWARLRLVQGESTAQGWELVGSLGQTTFSVGSGSQSTWQVRGEGVQPLHFTLHWDGTILRVADLANHGDVRVDGILVGSAWHPLMGHARLEFGRAAMMVDSSAARAGDSDHPLDPGFVPPGGFSDPASGAMPRLHKATLLGVASVDLKDAQDVQNVKDVRSSSSVPPASDSDFPSLTPGATGGFRVSRPTDSERVRKATLLGAAVSVPPPPGVPEAPVHATPSRGLSTGTLMGVAAPLDAWPRARAQDEKTGDVRTIVGMPMGDATIRSALGTAVTQTELRPISSSPPAERIGSTWHEAAGAERTSLGPDTLHDVEPPLGGSRYVDPARIPLPNPASTRPGAGTGSESRAGALDTQGRGPGSASASPRRSFPLQYVGIVMLTCAAYFAWLYLLDHW
jgi:hypothetical protein